MEGAGLAHGQVRVGLRRALEHALGEGRDQQITIRAGSTVEGHADALAALLGALEALPGGHVGECGHSLALLQALVMGGQEEGHDAVQADSIRLAGQAVVGAGLASG